MDSGSEMEEQQNYFASSINPLKTMASLKALRKSYEDGTETAANSAKTATYKNKCSQSSRFSGIRDSKPVRTAVSQR